MLFLNLASYLILLVGWPYFVYRIIRGKETCKSLKQKFGIYTIPKPPPGAIWVHAVSVGETNTAVPLVDRLLAENTETKIIFSVSTMTGMEVARKKLTEKVILFFYPYDFPFAVKSALAFFKPSKFIFMETEIWPNFLKNCKQAYIPTMLINGRISDNSYNKYLKAKSILSPAISGIDKLLMQSEIDAKRIASLGAKKEAIEIAGSIKFDIPLPEVSTANRNEIRKKFELPESACVIIFASTHFGEDELFIKTFISLKKKFPGLFTIIAPRHPERGREIAMLCTKFDLLPAQRSKSESPDKVLVLDTVGELGTLYGGADLAVMGGSFIPHGGQNPLEPASWELPVLFGPYMHNFRDISSTLITADGALQLADSSELETAIATILSDENVRKKMGESGRKAILQNQGSLGKTVDEIAKLNAR